MNIFLRIQQYFLPESFLIDSKTEEYFKGVVLFWVILSASILFSPSFIFQLLSPDVPFLNKSLIGLTWLILLLSFALFLFFTRYRPYHFFQFLKWGSCFLVFSVCSILMGFAVIAKSFNSSAFFILPLMPIALAYFAKPKYGFVLAFFLVIFVSVFYYYFYFLGHVGDNVIDFWTRGKIHYVDSLAALALASTLAWIHDYTNKQMRLQIKNKEQTISDQQQKLFHSAKFHALGEMAASLAHEINNPLFVIQGKVHSMRSLLHKDQLDKEKCDEVVSSVEETVIRLSRIVRGISSFARINVKSELVEVSLRDLIKDVIFLSQERMNEFGITCEIENEQAELFYKCYPAYITQILINLLNNSVDALHSIHSRKILISFYSQQTTVFIEVHDNGVGVRREDQDRIFEAFYTTKSYGRGTGLGLSISRSLAEEHGGELVLKSSKLGRGAAFSLQLPKHFISSCDD